MEVSQHVRHGVEPQVVDVALPVLIHRQTQMLGERRKDGGGDRKSTGESQLITSSEGDIGGENEMRESERPKKER